MNISGKKVRLRAIEAVDCDLLMSLINDAETEFMLGGWSFPVSKREQDHWFENNTRIATTLRVMIDVGENTIGTAMLSDIDYKNGTAQIHIKLCPGDCRHHGYGTDTVNTLVGYAFSELRLHCVYAQVSEHNVASQRLFVKCGFEKEGLLRDRLFKRAHYISVVMFSIVCHGGECDVRDWQ